MLSVQMRNLLQAIKSTRNISLLSVGQCLAVVVMFFYCTAMASAQVTGGQHAFEYLRLSNAPHVSALGGISVANPDNDIAFALQNPAMMRPGLHNNLELNYDNFYADIKILNLQYGYHVPKLNTSFFLGVQYLNYGSFMETDPIGNTYGTFHAVDYALTAGASRTYLEHWRYGADIKMAKSNFTSVSAMAAMIDVGINYFDTSTLWDFGAVAKNMGVMVKDYTTGNSEPIPFDLQLGVSKRFKHLPLRLIGTIHHLYEWDIRYSNPADLNGTNAFGKSDTITDKGSHFADKFFRHFIFGAELTLGKRVTLSVSYNDLQRRELALSTIPGLAGFAFGAGLELTKFQVHYGRTYYHIAGAYNEIGITMALNRLIGLNKTGEKIHWNDEYPDAE
jgi:hypothetical protein